MRENELILCDNLLPETGPMENITLSEILDSVWVRMRLPTAEYKSEIEV